jgi:chaperonin GroES
MSTFKKLLPTFDRVVVRKLKADTKVGGILLPEKAQKKNLTAEVIAVGPGRTHFDGKFVPVQLKVNQRVLIPEFGGLDVEVGDETLQVFREDDIIAVVE